MSEVTLRARSGRSTGSGESRRIRRAGAVPAIVYGKKTSPLNLAVDAHDLHMALHTEAGSNVLINLEIEGGDRLLTMARVIERHPYRNEYRHVDFVTVFLDEKVTAEVVIHFEGTPIGVKDGGVFSPARTHVMVETFPANIPSFIELDVFEVELGGALRVSDLPAIDGVAYMDDPDAVVMSVTAPAAEEPETAVEMLEGEAAETEGGDSGAGDEGEDTE